MKGISFGAGVFLVIGVFFAAAPRAGAETERQSRRYLVRFQQQVQEESARQILRQYGLEPVRRIPELGIVVGETKTPRNFQRRFLDRLRGLEKVVYVEADAQWKALLRPNDPQYTSQAEYQRLSIESAWDRQTGSRQIVVAVTDTGIDLNHSDLRAQLWTNPAEVAGNGVDDDGNGFVDDIHGWNFASGSNNPNDDNQHGTHVAGIIGAEGNNGIGIAGVNWRVSLMALKFLDRNGSGSTEHAVDSILYAARNGARVINASWGGGENSQALRDAIRFARDRGTLFVAAAGNDSSNNDVSPTYPANYEEALAVASSEAAGRLSSFSNYGGTSVGLAAPGSDIFSTLPGNQYGRLSGTSMAAPMISGLAALILSSSPGLSPIALRNAILNGVDLRSGYDDDLITEGDANAAKSLDQLSQGFQVWPSKFNLAIEKQFDMTAFAPNGAVEWSSSNTGVLTVDSNGKVTAVATGEAQIQARDGAGHVATASVTVLRQSTAPFPGCDFAEQPAPADPWQQSGAMFSTALPVLAGLWVRRRNRRPNEPKVR